MLDSPECNTSADSWVQYLISDSEIVRTFVNEAHLGAVGQLANKNQLAISFCHQKARAKKIKALAMLSS
jgi:hypothetical protein